jgi:hypothetical protein
MNRKISLAVMRSKLTKATLSITAALTIAGLWSSTSVLNILAQETETQPIENLVTIQQEAQNIEFVSQIGGEIDGVAVSGNYAYLAASANGLRIFNVANPATPIEVGSYDTPGDAQGITVVGNYAYLADGGSGLRIINIANPAAPAETGFYNTPGYAWEVAVLGNYAYVADSYSGLRIINVKPVSNQDKLRYTGEAGCFNQETAYIANEMDSSALSMSVTRLPRLVASYRGSLAVSGNFACAAALAWCRRANPLQRSDSSAGRMD